MSKPTLYIKVLLVFVLVCANSRTVWGKADNAVPDTLNYIPQDYLPADTIFARFLQSKGIPLTRNNEITLISSGKQKFDLLFADIEKARQLIHLEYFNFRNDSVATRLFQLLAKKAREEVKIRAMYDDFGNMSNNRPLRKKHLETWNKRGIELLPYDPIRFPYINHVFSRDHQKIVVIDNKIAYTGGMNVADYYINGLPDIGAWRDMHLRLKGASVLELQKAFLHTWNKETRQGLSLDSMCRVVQPDLDQTTDTLGGRVAIVQRIPRETPAIMREAYVQAIDAAEHRIQLINPYFAPTRSIRKALERAVKRGVRVEIMISGKSDIPVTPDAAYYTAYQLHKKGAHVYIFNGGFHHSKVLIIDERFATIGSTNLNARSLRYDYEINAFLFDLPATAELVRIFEADKRDSTPLTPSEYRKAGFVKRTWRWMAHLLTPFL